MIDIYTIILLCIASFVAGLVDAIVGGGGLIQLPAGIVLLPTTPVNTIIGTLKFPAFCGTSFATLQYAKQQSFNKSLLLILIPTALLTAILGSWTLTLCDNSFLKPVLLVVLSGVAVYTFFKKDLGQQKKVTEHTQFSQQLTIRAFFITLLIGFYDGFIGPGTGSFLILTFISFLGFDFLEASAYAKLINLATNTGSIILFLIKGKIIWLIALPMALCNSIGGFIGARMAIQKGNRFIRIIFLIVVCGTLLRFAYDVFNNR